MKTLLIAIFSVLLVENASADCAAMHDREVTAKLDRVAAPLYDSYGKKVPGCLFEAEGKVLGYAIRDDLCRTPVGKIAKIHLAFGCCDTGADVGDVECIVRTRPASGIGAVHGNGMVIVSIAL